MAAPVPASHPEGRLSETPPRTLGRYQISRELGRGAMGVVYEAHDPDLDRTVALKTINMAFAVAPADRETFEKRFFVEARIAARLSHAAIVLVHDVGRDAASGILYIALERLEGHTVAELTARGRALPWPEALRIAKGMAEALQYAHAHKVVHLDVKPANVMVLPSGDPKLMDFGIAHIGTTGMKLTGSGQSFGTPLFMSPEQILGGEVDARADLFALGSILYTMVTGRHAFAAPSITAILNRVLSEAPAPPSQLVPGLPAGIDAIVAHALAKSRDSRYPDAQTMAEDIADVREGRSPRHHEGWTPGILDEAAAPPPPSAEAFAEMELESLPDEAAAAAAPLAQSPSGWDVDAALDRLVEPVPSAPDATSQSTRELQPAVATGPSTSTTAAPRHIRALDKWRAILWSAGAGIAVLVGVALLHGWRHRADPSPERGPMAIGASPEGAVKPGPPTMPASAPASETAFLAVDFQHALRTGRVLLWVDGEKIFEDTLDSRVSKKILTLKLRRGVVTETLELTPGRHQIRVQVLWDDNERTETITGTFRPGQTRRLEIRLGRLRKDLSVDWR